MKISKRTTALVGGTAVLMAVCTTTGAVAGDLIRSKDIADGAVHGVDLSTGVNSRLDRTTTYAAGAGYTTTWEGGKPDTLQTAREECPEGEYATGGGFSTWGGDKDLGGDNKNIQITVSAPYFEGDYVPISDQDSRFRPREWVVKGYNLGVTDQIVRAWVTCAKS